MQQPGTLNIIQKLSYCHQKQEYLKKVSHIYLGKILNSQEHQSIFHFSAF